MTMTDEQCEKKYPGRKHRDFYVDAGKHVTGFACSKDQDGMWWVPEAGYSMSFPGSLHTTKDAAIKAYRADLERQRADIDRSLAKLPPG